MGDDMKVNMDYEESVKSIDEMLNALPKELQNQEKAVLGKIGRNIKKNVVRFLHSSDVEARAKQIMPSNYDGSRPYIHLKDDVQSSVRKDKMGNHYVSVRGGKMTGYKWGPVSDGHIARDGITFVQGTNFMSRTVTASEGDTNKIIDEMLKKVVQ